MSNPDRLEPGTTLGRYEIGRPLGRGGMGAVYQAMHRDLRKQVAVKVLAGSLAHDEVAKQRFLREGEAASRIRHPHVVDVTDVGTEGDHTYLVMELLEGEDLASRIQRGPLEPQEAVDVLLPVLAGVHAAHQEGIIHRDLKPENIFLARQRIGGLMPKVLDFGVSKLATDGKAMALTGTAAVFGTPFYMPPEQVRGARQADHRSDQYALGVVLYEALTGRRPYEGDNVYAILHAIGAGQFPRPRSLRPQIPEPLEAAILRSMTLDPAGRFPSVAAFGAALLPFASDTTRAVWSGTFRTAISASAATAVLPPGADPAAGVPTPSAITPPPGPPGSISGTRLLDSKPPPTKTTLGAATGQMGTDAGPLRRNTGRWVGAAAALAGAAGLVLAINSGVFSHDPPAQTSAPPLVAPARAAPLPPPDPEPATFVLDVTANPTEARFELDGAPAGNGRLHRIMPRDGSDHRLVVRAPGYRDTEVVFADHSPPSLLTLSPEPAAPTRLASPQEEHHHRRATAAPRPTEPTQPRPSQPPREPTVTRTANGAPVLD
ncbi:MAG TPA: serine/threonine-protein kinase [Polyangia bacterium]|nr:serine/threonine-protein kinase [Polyangia bacterium]